MKKGEIRRTQVKKYDTRKKFLKSKYKEIINRWYKETSSARSIKKKK